MRVPFALRSRTTTLFSNVRACPSTTTGFPGATALIVISGFGSVRVAGAGCCGAGCGGAGCSGAGGCGAGAEHAMNRQHVKREMTRIALQNVHVSGPLNEIGLVARR